MSDFILYTPRQLVWLKNLFLKKNEHGYVDAKKIEKTSLQKQLRNTGKDRYTYRFECCMCRDEISFQPRKESPELCGLIPEVVVEHDDDKINELNQCLTEKWSHIMPLPASFHGELIRWRSRWKLLQRESLSITNILKQHADATF